MPVEIKTFLRNYSAGAYDDKQKIIWTQQRSPEMEWLLLNAKPAELNDNGCQHSSTSNMDAERDTKQVIDKKMQFLMSYDGIKLTTTVNHNDKTASEETKSTTYFPNRYSCIQNMQELNTNQVANEKFVKVENTPDYIGMFTANPEELN